LRHAHSWASSEHISLGVGGAPRGRVVEIFGPEASGKTTLVQNIIAEAQRTGGVHAIIDAEHALDPECARKFGVDVDNLFISQPDSGEQALEIAESLVRSAAFDVVAIDSVAALVPRAELEGEMGDSHMGLRRGLCRRRCASSRVPLAEAAPASFSPTSCATRSAWRPLAAGCSRT
jgi:recombination protein RecA